MNETYRVATAKRRNCFTLIEILVVIGIIGILAGILIPAVMRAKTTSLRTECRSNLRSIGQAIHMYLNESQERMPVAAQMPSLNSGLPRICDVLAPHLENRNIFRCPADDKGYFEAEGSSYEYRMILMGEKLDELARRRLGNNTFIMFDYEPFHGKPGTKGASNYLFIDGRVDDLTND